MLGFFSSGFIDQTNGQPKEVISFLFKVPILSHKLDLFLFNSSVYSNAILAKHLVCSNVL